MRAFGIDLAGYTCGTSVCAEAATARTGSVSVRVIAQCPFSRARQTGERLQPILDEEASFLRQMLARGPIAVDIPIDLQGLPQTVRAEQVWELTLRPIDRVLNAMPPFADRIGAPVARFQKILRRAKLRAAVGTSIFETYPAANLRNLQTSRDALRESWRDRERTELNNDEVDAAICALTALARDGHRLAETALATKLQPEFERRRMSRRDLPQGYVLLQDMPVGEVTVARINAADWCAETA